MARDSFVKQSDGSWKRTDDNGNEHRITENDDDDGSYNLEIVDRNNTPIESSWHHSFEDAEERSEDMYDEIEDADDGSP